MTLIAAVVFAQLTASAQAARPVLAFPEPGLDDSAAYQGYRTRFLRDAAGNTVQIYIDRRGGRVVNLWADAANASAGFTARDARGRAVPLEWDGDEALVGRSGDARYVEYRLLAGPGPIEIGRILLGSMRLERDFQYRSGHLEPFGAGELERPELLELIDVLERLNPVERRRHLELLHATGTAELRSRLRPGLVQSGGVPRVFRAEQPTFDGRNRLSLELSFPDADASLDSARRAFAVRSRDGRPIRLVVRVTTDAATLTPLRPDEIFNADFMRFYRGVRDAARRAAGPRAADAAARFRRLDRQIRSAELLSSEEKLMAGLPNYATYFGRDMMMSALMLEPIWSDAMLEHVIASVLRKLNAAGEVSHEEALGGQAIRENAAVYNALMGEYFRTAGAARQAHADTLLVRARAVLGELQSVRENYHMVDDDFQLPVLVARYLGDPSIPADRKRAFLHATDGPDGSTRLERLLRNLAFVAHASGPYAREPAAMRLIGFARRSDGSWAPGSWRDSGAGYAGGRFAMDVNAIWVPRALAAMDTILAVLDAIGDAVDERFMAARTPADSSLHRYIRDRDRLRAAVETWRGARRHFDVHLSPPEAQRRVRAWLDALSEPERGYWAPGLEAVVLDPAGIRFPAVALDSAGRPIPVMNTDPATRLFLEDVTAAVLAGDPDVADEAVAELEPFLLPYPFGLFVPELGPLVASDVYATPEVQAAFRGDLYHSPRVVWGREVNLLLLGLARQLSAAYDASGRLRDPALAPYARRLREALNRTRASVDASRLKHNELWSYRIDGGRLLPIRYGASTDIQLWNLTDLAVQYALGRLPAVGPARTVGSP